MQFYRAALMAGVIGMAVSGCGYLPSELNQGFGGAHARVQAKKHTTGCDAPARGFRKVGFNRLYRTTGDRDEPFEEVKELPVQYDVYAYVWGFSQCPNCDAGDHYILIERGPGNDFSTWVVTPQYPSITIQSKCRDRLRVGERYRFSFTRGHMVGFSR